MNSDKDSFHKMALLTGARIFGILFSIFIPMYLGRKLSVPVYGTYKQIMLVFWFAQVALNLGVDDSAYFYLRKNPKHFPQYSFNALVFNLMATGLLWALMVVFKNPIGILVKNEGLIEYIPLTGMLLLLTVSSMQIEGILIGLNRFRERLILEMGMELLKSTAIVLSFLIFNSIRAVLISLSILMFIRLLYTFYVINVYKIKNQLSYVNGLPYLKEQLKFGLPLGISRVLQNLLNIENFFISSYFSLIQFTYYTIGCFENPLINAARTSLFELVNIDLIDAQKDTDHKKSLNVWKRMNRKLFLIVLPFVIYMMFFAKEIITFIFSAKYLESVPFFILFNIYILMSCLNPEPLFRATLKTQFVLKLRILGLLLGALFIFGGAYWGGALMALGGKTTALFITNTLGLYIGAKLIESNIIDLFDWNELLKITTISIALSLPLKAITSYLNWHPFFILSLTFSLFFIFLLSITWKWAIIKEDEKDLLKSYLNKIF